MKRNITAVIVLIVMTPILFAGHTRFPKIENEPVILGLDHIPIAVTDLDKAVSLFEELGFTLKPGRFHENGIRNSHIKFKDGTEIEIISAEENRDALTAEYLNHLQLGDGPVFVGFYAARLAYLSEWFDQAEVAHQIEGGLLAFPESSSLRYIFFGRRQASPTDKPEHFVHDNGADGLVSVWLAGDEFDREEEL